MDEPQGRPSCCPWIFRVDLSIHLHFCVCECVCMFAGEHTIVCRRQTWMSILRWCLLTFLLSPSPLLLFFLLFLLFLLLSFLLLLHPFSSSFSSSNHCQQQQQLQAQHLSHGHGPPVPLTPHPSGLQPPGIPPLGGSASLLALSSALSGQSHLAIKDDKKHHDAERHRGERPGKPD